MDSFQAVNKIHKIPVELFDQGYRHFSFIFVIFESFLTAIAKV